MLKQCALSYSGVYIRSQDSEGCGMLLVLFFLSVLVEREFPDGSLSENDCPLAKAIGSTLLGCPD